MDRQSVISTLESLANGTETLGSPNAANAILAALELLKTRPGKFAAAGTPWSAEEDARLAREFDSGMTVAQMALQHGRTSAAINLRLVKLGRLDPAAVKTRSRSRTTNIDPPAGTT